ncbi:helix-turn-helix domain-containing protein [Microvirga puerhi]|uniref:Helix-turn-helix domain-containing protein n=1 Tax=Microvirga puerhi TaxID=2876078 RepID=A0ABS7VUU2_9HYPH|nr:helix-turn-helix transcriptional regulator [Microvirga puerhi]MBZ6078825.1 helix-turn-helix domain-containing protein [Microvirga puerhi]
MHYRRSCYNDNICPDRPRKKFTMNEQRRRTKSVSETDKLIGRLIRHQRNLRQMSQEGLSRRIGVTFQQLQKYENGSNRVSASRLFQISEILNVPVTVFFGPRAEETLSEYTQQEMREIRQFIDGFARLSAKDKGVVVSLVEGLADKKARRPRSGEESKQQATNGGLS